MGICAIWANHSLSIHRRLIFRLYCIHAPAKVIQSLTLCLYCLCYIVFVEFIVICPVLGLLALHLVLGGLTFHILCRSVHCSFNRWLTSCLNSHQTQHAISTSINSPELMNTIAAFLGKTFNISECIYRDPEILGKSDQNNIAVFSHCVCHNKKNG